MMRCTACGSVNVRRSAVRSAEHGHHALRSPYRCQDCNARFWVPSRKLRTTVLATLAGALTIAFFAATSIVLPRYAPPPLNATLLSLPDQNVNETHRLDLIATEPLPETAESIPALR